jgi:plasmid replication initiation protein
MEITTTNAPIVPRTEIWQGNEITKARYQFTALEINVMCMVFWKVRQTEGDFLQYYFTFDEYEKKTGLSASNLFQLKKAIKELQGKIFQYQPDKNNWISAPLISGVKIDSLKGIVYFNIDPFIKPLITEVIKNTTRYFLETVFNITSKNGKRLYHFMSMYKSAGKLSMSFSDIKYKLFQDETYEGFSSFIKYVLEPSIKQINDVSELEIKFTTIKKYGGDKLINFIINEKKPEFINEEMGKVYELLKRDNLVEWFIQNTLRTLTPEQIYTAHYDTQIHARRNKGAYLRTLLIAMGVPETKI